MLELKIYDNKNEMGLAASEKTVELFKSIQSKYKIFRFIAATGASQFEFLEALSSREGIDWSKTEMFHLDEYVGLPETHPASFRRYLKERLVEKVHPGKVHFIQGDAADIEKECFRVNELISSAPIDVAFVGIGENGHLAFNDPPADFKTADPYIIVDLDEKCRNQQVGEGWFDSIQEVPRQAVSMSIKQIMKSRYIICVCPDQRKAEAVKNCLSKDATISPEYPASILKSHPNVYCFLDKHSASLL